MTYFGNVSKNDNLVRSPLANFVEWETNSTYNAANVKYVITEGDYVYLLTSDLYIYRAPKHNPTNFYFVSKVNVSSTVNFFNGGALVENTIGGSIPKYWIYGGFGSSGTGIQYIASCGINGDGSPDLANWTISSSTLPSGDTRRKFSGLYYAPTNKVYLFGGGNGGNITVSLSPTTPHNTIYVSSAGDPSTLSTSSGTLPTAVHSYGMAQVGGRVYIYGGATGNMNSPTNIIQSAPLYDLENSWTTETNTLPIAMHSIDTYVDANYVYLIGVATSSTSTSPNIYRAPVSDPTNFSMDGYYIGMTFTPQMGLKVLDAGDDKLYTFSSSVNNYFRVASADKTDPLTWSLYKNALPTSFSETCIGYDYNTKKSYLLGGNAGSGVSSAIYESVENAPYKWSLSSSTLPVAIGWGEFLMAGNNSFIVGNRFSGLSSSSSMQVMYNYNNSDPASWQTLTFTNSKATYLGKSAIINNSIYYFGGTDNSGGTNYIQKIPLVENKIDAYSASLNSTKVSSSPTLPTSMYAFSLVVAGGYVYIFGGMQGASAVSTAYRCPVDAIDAGTWTTISSALPSARAYMTECVVGDWLYLIGGTDSTTVVSSNIIFKAKMSDLANGVVNFSTFAPPDITAQAGASAICVDDTLYYMGGFTNTIASPSISSMEQKNESYELLKLAEPFNNSSTSAQIAINPETGHLASYGKMQRYGLLPWRVKP